MAFDGRHLHAALHELRLDSGSDDGQEVRFTFLVNVWLGHRPQHCQPFPTASLAQMSNHVFPGIPLSEPPSPVVSLTLADVDKACQKVEFEVDQTTVRHTLRFGYDKMRVREGLGGAHAAVVSYGAGAGPSLAPG